MAKTLQQKADLLASALIQGDQRLQDELSKLWRLLLYTTMKGRQRSRKTTAEALHAYWLDLPQINSAKAL